MQSEVLENNSGNQSQKLEGVSIINQDRLGLLKLSVKAAFLAGAPALRAVEDRIRLSLKSESSELTNISTYLLDLGGKRMRPLLTILVGQLFGMKIPSNELIDAAAGIELIHMATLLHDDIIDQSPLRRSKPSAYNQYGLPSTLLSGDFLLVRAFGICAHLDNFVIEETEKACVSLTEGEIIEGFIEADNIRPLDEYVRVVEKKTASLFTLASVVGSHLAGGKPKDVSKLRVFGANSGIAFQMIDDILDVSADEDLLGKPAGTDLRQRTPSLVNILWQELDPVKANEFFSKPSQTEEEIKETLKYLMQSKVLEQARIHAKDFAGRATNALLALDETEINTQVRDQLFSLLDYTLERCL
jgi:geranylgeranyl pyrophosphate synthase